MGWREALFSLNARSIGKTTHAAGTAGAFIRYVAREEAQPVIIAEHMPESAREARTWMDRQERAMRKNARVMDKLRIALPRDLSEAERAQLVREYMAELTGGRIPWYAAIHQAGKDAHNPHVHIGIVDRDIDTGKRVLRLSDNARDRQKAGLPGPKAIEWVRERWEAIGNRALERAGSDARLDRRTLKAQGIDREPTIHEGPGARKIHDHVKRPRSRQRINGCGRVIDYPSIDHGRTRREFNAQIIDLNLAKAAKSKHPPTVVWAQFEKDEAARDKALETRLIAEARARTAERRGAGKPYDERIKKLSSERKLKLQTARWNVRERFEGPRMALQARQQRERQALKNRQSRLHARIFKALDFTGITKRKQEAARRVLAGQHKQERAEFSVRYNDAKKQAEHYVRVRYRAEIAAQQTKRQRHVDLLKEKHTQAENFAGHERQQREIERDHMRQITQRKIDAWQKDQKEDKEKTGGDKARSPMSDSFARAILRAAKKEAQRPKDKGIDRDYGR